LEQIEAVKKARKKIYAQAAVEFDPKRDTAETYSKRIGLGFCTSRFFLPYLTYCESKAAMDFQAVRLAVALLQYHKEHGDYPEKLDALVPRYVAKVPKDIFLSDSPLHYRREELGFVLYSVGVNGKDDQGRRCPSNSWTGGSKDANGNPIWEDDDGNIYHEDPISWDDIVVQIPTKYGPKVRWPAEVKGYR
jgi:hypothetical protein